MRARNVVIFTLLVLMVLALVVTVLHFFRSEPAVPPVTLPQTAPGENLLPGGIGAPDAEQIIRVDVDTVQTVIGTLRRVESYSRKLTVERRWSGGGSTSSISVWVRGGSLRAVVREGGESAEKNVLIRDGELWIWYGGERTYYHAAAQAQDADEYQTLLHYEDILSLPTGSIVDAGYVDYGGESCVYVRYVDGPLSYDHACYLSIETGLLMAEEVRDGDTLVYAMRSSGPELSTPNEQLFNPPA